MTTYITEHLTNGVLYAGDRIEACSWGEANAQAQEQGLVLVGELFN